MSPRSANHDGFDAKTYAIIGAAQEVHAVLGRGYLERVYQRALVNELGRRSIPALAEVDVPVIYKGDVLDCSYRVDFLCYGEVIVELKAQSSVGEVEEAQVLNYLKASAFDVGLLLNFGESRLRVRRFSMSWVRDRGSEASAPSAVPPGA